MNTVESKVYAIIEKKASSNTWIQAISGIAGFPFTLFVDTSIIFTHYGKMFNEIRKVYGRKPIGMEAIGTFINGCKDEVLMDLVVDKIVGNIPIVGIPANMISARAMTWRLGLVMGMLSARGEEISSENVRKAAVLVREAFPQSKSLLFQKPSREVAMKLLNVVENISMDSFNDKLNRILNQIAC